MRLQPIGSAARSCMLCTFAARPCSGYARCFSAYVQRLRRVRAAGKRCILALMVLNWFAIRNTFFTKMHKNQGIPVAKCGNIAIDVRFFKKVLANLACYQQTI